MMLSLIHLEQDSSEWQVGSCEKLREKVQHKETEIKYAFGNSKASN